MVRRQRSVAICREGYYYLFVLAFIVGGATLREKNLLFILAGMMIGPLLFNWRVVVLSMRQLTVTRLMPGQAFAGRPLRIELEAHNDRRRLGSWAVVIEDDIEYQGPQPPATAAASGRRSATKARAMFPFVGANTTAKTAYRVTLPRRGRYRLGPLTVFTRFPLGLLKASLSTKQYQPLLVFPQLGQLSPDWLHRLEAGRLGVQQTFQRQGPIDGDYYGLREWRPGDSKRWIHWRTSAKLGKLAVRQFEQPQNRDLILVLDLWQPGESSEADWWRVERVVSCAATVIDHVCQRGGSRLTVALAGATTSIATATATPVFAHDMMERLALVEAAAENQVADVVAEVLADVQPGTQVLVIGTRPLSTLELSAAAVIRDHQRISRALTKSLFLSADGEMMQSVFRLGS